MADPSRGWQIKENLRTRLQSITVANGYRTDAGADVRLEADKTPVLAPMITLFTGSRVFPQDARAKGEREIVFIVEARVPAALDNALEMIDAIDEDLEQALDEYLPQPLALPLAFEESVIIDRPDGVAEVVVQQMYSTRYRR